MYFWSFLEGHKEMSQGNTFVWCHFCPILTWWSNFFTWNPWMRPRCECTPHMTAIKGLSLKHHWLSQPLSPHSHKCHRNASAVWKYNRSIERRRWEKYINADLRYEMCITSTVNWNKSHQSPTVYSFQWGGRKAWIWWSSPQQDVKETTPGGSGCQLFEKKTPFSWIKVSLPSGTEQREI